MAKVTLYTTDICPYCTRAKNLLKEKGVAYEEIDISKNEVLREQMMQRTGGKRTVPQIFIGDKLVGGADELQALENQGKLDNMLAGK